MSRFAALVAGSFALALFGATVVGNAQQDPNTPVRASQSHGSYYFQTYCAACHGTSARGDGPLADSMRKRPANLTEILKRNSGVFPKDLIFQVIDGRQPVRGHGGPDMPVWGDAFKRSIEGGSEDAVRNRIQAIVDYLEAIQLRNGE